MHMHCFGLMVAAALNNKNSGQQSMQVCFFRFEKFDNCGRTKGASDLSTPV